MTQQRERIAERGAHCAATAKRAAVGLKEVPTKKESAFMSKEDITSAQPAKPTAKGKMFAETICDKLNTALTEIAAQHPEIGSLAAIIDWKGTLNDADIPHGVWVSDLGGQVTKPERMLGSAWQTLKVLNQQLGAATAFLQAVQKKLLQVSKELLELQQQKDSTSAPRQGE